MSGVNSMYDGPPSGPGTLVRSATGPLTKRWCATRTVMRAAVRRSALCEGQQATSCPINGASPCDLAPRIGPRGGRAAKSNAMSAWTGTSTSVQLSSIWLNCMASISTPENSNVTRLSKSLTSGSTAAHSARKPARRTRQSPINSRDTVSHATSSATANSGARSGSCRVHGDIRRARVFRLSKTGGDLSMICSDSMVFLRAVPRCSEMEQVEPVRRSKS